MGQVRSLPKKDVSPLSRRGRENLNASQGRRLSASSSLAEFAQMNQDSGVLNAVTMETLSVGARFYRELKVPENESKATKINPFEPKYGEDDEIIVDKKNNIRARLSRSRTATFDVTTLESPSYDNTNSDDDNNNDRDIEEGGGAPVSSSPFGNMTTDSRRRTNSKEKCMSRVNPLSSKNSSPRKGTGRIASTFSSPLVLEPGGLEAGEILDAESLSRHVIIAGSMADLPRFVSELRRS